MPSFQTQNPKFKTPERHLGTLAHRQTGVETLGVSLLLGVLHMELFGYSNSLGPDGAVCWFSGGFGFGGLVPRNV